MRIRIRIQQLKLMRIHADPDPDTDPDPKPCNTKKIIAIRGLFQHIVFVSAALVPEKMLFHYYSLISYLFWKYYRKRKSQRIKTHGLASGFYKDFLNIALNFNFFPKILHLFCLLQTFDDLTKGLDFRLAVFREF
jgi:hypothetical protein